MVVQFLALLAAGLGTAFALDKWVGHETPTLFYLAVFGSFISYIYSAPPLKLKQSGWAGNYALGSSYISLPWWAGQVCILVRLSSKVPEHLIGCNHCRPARAVVHHQFALLSQVVAGRTSC